MLTGMSNLWRLIRPYWALIAVAFGAMLIDGDEPSAALDAESEELVLDALARLMEGRTSLTIPHRLATIRRAEITFVLDDGVITARGSHDQLIAESALYNRVFRLQLPDAFHMAGVPPARQ
jgi:subfamily B ATP-binding cassette protein MsbA